MSIVSFRHPERRKQRLSKPSAMKLSGELQKCFMLIAKRAGEERPARYIMGTDRRKTS